MRCFKITHNHRSYSGEDVTYSMAFDFDGAIDAFRNDENPTGSSPAPEIQKIELLGHGVVWDAEELRHLAGEEEGK